MHNIVEEVVNEFPFKPNAFIREITYLLCNNSYDEKFLMPGDGICVLNIIYSSQLVEIVCRINKKYIHGFIKNTTKNIQYKKQDEWMNENEYKMFYQNISKNFIIGSLSPFEIATPLYYKKGAICLVINTCKGNNTKTGFVFENSC